MWMVIMQPNLTALELNIFQKKLKKVMGNITDIERIQAYNSTMYGYFWAGFYDFILKSKSWLDYKNLFSSNK